MSNVHNTRKPRKRTVKQTNTSIWAKRTPLRERFTSFLSRHDRFFYAILCCLATMLFYSFPSIVAGKTVPLIELVGVCVLTLAFSAFIIWICLPKRTEIYDIQNIIVHKTWGEDPHTMRPR